MLTCLVVYVRWVVFVILWQILKNNKYNPSHTDDKTRKCTDQQDISNGKDNRDSHRWAKFTYLGKETKFIMKLFKNLPIRIAFTTNISIGRLLSQKPNRNSNSKLDNSGVYRLTCPDCQTKYVGQTGRSFQIRFQEYHRDFKHNNAKSKFAANQQKTITQWGKSTTSWTYYTSSKKVAPWIP